MHNVKGSDNEVFSQEKSPLAFTGILPEEKTGRGAQDTVWQHM